MRSYVVSRISQTFVVLLLVTVIVFLASRLSGSPVDLMLPEGASDEQRAALIRRLGLESPLPLQYWTFLTDALTGDFGDSTRFHMPALELVLSRLGATIQLAVAALAIAVVVGGGLGILAALRQGKTTDHVTTVLLTAGQASPPFWVGILLILIVGVELQWLPFMGNQGFESLILPAVTLSIFPLVNIARITRSSMINTIRQDYVRTAWAKGMRLPSVVGGHLLRNALIPVVTVGGVVFGQTLSGAVITEQVFSWPGIGSLAIEAIGARDYAVVQAVTLIGAVFVVVLNLLVDLSYFVLDPRVRVGRAAV